MPFSFPCSRCQLNSSLSCVDVFVWSVSSSLWGVTSPHTWSCVWFLFPPNFRPPCVSVSVRPDVHQHSDFEVMMELLINLHPSRCFHEGGIWEETRIPRLRARSSRSVFNLLTEGLISQPITQQLTPNWLLSFSYGWACAWIYCRCAKVHVHCDYVISDGKGGLRMQGFGQICTEWQTSDVLLCLFGNPDGVSLRSGTRAWEHNGEGLKLEEGAVKQWDGYLKKQLKSRRPEEPQTTGRSRTERNKQTKGSNTGRENTRGEKPWHSKHTIRVDGGIWKSWGCTKKCSNVQ